MTEIFALNRLEELPGAARVATIGNRVYETLKTAIVELGLRPGNLLSEADVAKQLGVSRQPVREAFIKLAEVGLVEIRPQRGTFVLLISRKEVVNARFIREAVEVALARRAAEQDISPVDVKRIRDNLAAQKKAAAENEQTLFLHLDEHFHHMLALSVDCEHAWRFLENIKVQLDRVRYLSLPHTTPLDKLLEQHTQIAEAIFAGDAEAAETAMRNHLAEVLTSMPEITAEHPDLFSE